jgi:hypothetical protein
MMVRKLASPCVTKKRVSKGKDMKRNQQWQGGSVNGEHSKGKRGTEIGNPFPVSLVAIHPQSVANFPLHQIRGNNFCITFSHIINNSLYLLFISVPLLCRTSCAHSYIELMSALLLALKRAPATNVRQVLEVRVVGIVPLDGPANLHGLERNLLGQVRCELPDGLKVGAGSSEHLHNEEAMVLGGGTSFSVALGVEGVTSEFMLERYRHFLLWDVDIGARKSLDHGLVGVGHSELRHTWLVGSRELSKGSSGFGAYGLL